MDKFLGTQNLARLSQKETENLNKPIMNKEVESVIKNFPMQKTLNQVASWVNTPNIERGIKANPSQPLSIN